jgi:hypothetical protein
MSPITSTLANGSAYGYRTLASGSSTAYESIATVTGSAQTTLTFSSIPSAYTSLQIRYAIKPTTGTGEALRLQFNGDTGNNYSRSYMGGQGSTVFEFGSANGAFTWGGDNGAGTQASGYPYVGIIDIHDYASTTRNKTVRTFFGTDSNGAGGVMLTQGVWLNTAATTSLTLFFASGDSLATGSLVSLYGIKGA